MFFCGFDKSHFKLIKQLYLLLWGINNWFYIHSKFTQQFTLQWCLGLLNFVTLRFSVRFGDVTFCPVCFTCPGLSNLSRSVLIFLGLSWSVLVNRLRLLLWGARIQKSQSCEGKSLNGSVKYNRYCRGLALLTGVPEVEVPVQPHFQSSHIWQHIWVRKFTSGKLTKKFNSLPRYLSFINLQISAFCPKFSSFSTVVLGKLF